jgi:hypothetical protein
MVMSNEGTFVAIGAALALACVFLLSAILPITYPDGFIAACTETQRVVVYADGRRQCVTEERRAELEKALGRMLPVQQ